MLTQPLTSYLPFADADNALVYARSAFLALQSADDMDDAALALVNMLSQSDVLPAAYRRAFAAAAVLMNRHDWQPRRHNRIA